MVGMSTACAAANSLETLSRSDQLGSAVVRPYPLHQHGGRHAEGLRQGDDGLEAGRDPSGLEPAQHRAADIRSPRHIGKVRLWLSRKRRAVRPRSSAGLSKRLTAAAAGLALVAG